MIENDKEAQPATFPEPLEPPKPNRNVHPLFGKLLRQWESMEWETVNLTDPRD